ncbi:MAG: hypothetical protein JNK35_07090 [Phycisphaerae bacterium]|nr:hypothetical protein [Phycisphaerae bacterium]
MQDQTGQLAVRQHERLQCRLRAWVSVAGESAERVVIGGGEAAAGSASGGGGGVGNGGAREIACEMIDCSAGGLGLRCGVFLPKACRVVVRVETGGGGAIEVGGRVQRVAMVDRKPTYYFGASLTGEGPEHQRRMAGLMEAARAQARGVESPGVNSVEGVEGVARA